MAESKTILLPFPVKGLDENWAYSDQAPLTSPDVQNVRAYDHARGRARGGQRPGLKKYCPDQLASGSSVQNVTHVVGTLLNAGGDQIVIEDQSTQGYDFYNESGSKYVELGTAGEYEWSVWADDYCYVAVQVGGEVYIRRHQSDGTLDWTGESLGAFSVVGMTIDSGFIFVMKYNFLVAPDVLKVDQADGSLLSSDYLSLRGNAYPHMDSYNGVIAVVVVSGLSGGGSVTTHLELFDSATGDSLAYTSVSPGVNEDGKIAGLSTNYAGGWYLGYTYDKESISPSHRVVRYDAALNVVWSRTISYVSGQKFDEMAYDQFNDRVVLLGRHIGGSTNQLKVIASADGADVDAGDGNDLGVFNRGLLCDSEGSLIFFDGNSTGTLYKYSSDLTEEWSATISGTGGGNISVNAFSQAEGNLNRTLQPVAVSGGNVYRFAPSAATLVANGTDALSATATTIQSTVFFQDIYFADGVSEKYYQGSSGSIQTWTASAGSLPGDTDGNRPRLIATWQGRLVQADLYGDKQNWFMSAVGDATDWDYAGTAVTSAVAGNNAEAGKNPDIINALIPWSDDLLLFGGDHTIHRLTGNPLEGGVIDLVTDTIGIAWGSAWCKDPSGVLYFFGSRGGVYRMSPGGVPQKITSRVIDERLADINLNSDLVRLLWNDRVQGVHVLVSPIVASRNTLNYFYDVRNDAWWVDVFANTNHNAVAAHVLDGDKPSDRVLLLGGRDGYLRSLDHDSLDDDGTAIDSWALLGPIQQESGDPIALTQLSGVLGAGSADVTYSLNAGDSAEDARWADDAYTGTWSSGRNNSVRRKTTGHAMFVRVRNTAADQSWALERIEADVKNTSHAFRSRFSNDSRAWEVRTAGFEVKEFDVSSQETSPSDVEFGDSGTKMYVVGSANGTVYQYTLSTAWDVDTASYASKSFDFSSQDVNPRGLFFKPDGTKIYMVGIQNDAVFQYSLSTPWDVSTASYDSVSLSVASQENKPRSVFIGDNGTKLYTLGITNETVYQYTLPAAWSLSGGSYASKSFAVTTEDQSPRAVYFRDDGKRMYVMGNTSDRVHQYKLTTAWDVSTAEYQPGRNFIVRPYDEGGLGISFKSDGTALYVAGLISRKIFQFTLG